MGIRMSTTVLEVRGNALDVAHTLTLVAARQRHYHPRGQARQDRSHPLLSPTPISIKIIRLYRPATTFFDALKLPFGAFETYLARVTFLPCGEGPMIRRLLALLVKTLLRDVKTRFRNLFGLTLRTILTLRCPQRFNSKSRNPPAGPLEQEQGARVNARASRMCASRPLGIGARPAGSAPAPDLNVVQG
ncbi:uncharacterized protein SCHCODRAFT_01093012 [Schizophyllum commune H4-8]|nr:uncharacterized protein SCHCODRAFT_01093012 [Schizophyllum commune H4-8]KAI5896612.1 hypothetical protein SCHCODRAFT_01093012 [Schizophyllum commune H4-8]